MLLHGSRVYTRFGRMCSTRSFSAGSTPSKEEMQPGSPEMLARATAVQSIHHARLLSPEQAKLFLMRNLMAGPKVLDVRTKDQRGQHEINGRAGRTIMGSKVCSLDDMVSGLAPKPTGPTLLVCSKGPKALVALGWLASLHPQRDLDPSISVSTESCNPQGSGAEWEDSPFAPQPEGPTLFALEGGITAWDALEGFPMEGVLENEARPDSG